MFSRAPTHARVTLCTRKHLDTLPARPRVSFCFSTFLFLPFSFICNDVGREIFLNRKCVRTWCWRDSGWTSLWIHHGGITRDMLLWYWMLLQWWDEIWLHRVYFDGIASVILEDQFIVELLEIRWEFSWNGKITNKMSLFLCLVCF